MAPEREEGVTDLSAREREVLRLLLAGHTAKSAAATLDLSVHTVNDYLREARRKLGVGSSREAARALADHEARMRGSAPSPPPDGPERHTPEKPAPERIGVSPAAPPADAPAPPATNRRTRAALAWTIGGCAMLGTILAAALLIAPPGSTGGDARKGETAMRQDSAAAAAALGWVRLIDDGDYEASWQRSSALFREAITADGLAAQVGPLRQRLGTVVTREVKSVVAHREMPGMPEGDYRIVEFGTDFSAAPGRVETVTLEHTKDGWAVIGYFIR